MAFAVYGTCQAMMPQHRVPSEKKRNLINSPLFSIPLKRKQKMFWSECGKRKCCMGMRQFVLFHCMPQSNSFRNHLLRFGLLWEYHNGISISLRSFFPVISSGNTKTICRMIQFSNSLAFVCHLILSIWPAKGGARATKRAGWSTWSRKFQFQAHNANKSAHSIRRASHQNSNPLLRLQ